MDIAEVEETEDQEERMEVEPAEQEEIKDINVTDVEHPDDKGQDTGEKEAKGHALAEGLATERSEGPDHLEAADGLADTTPDHDTRTARALQGLDTEVVDLAVEEEEEATHERQTELASAADGLAARTGRLNLPLRHLYLPPEQAD